MKILVIVQWEIYDDFQWDPVISDDNVRYVIACSKRQPKTSNTWCFGRREMIIDLLLKLFFFQNNLVSHLENMIGFLSVELNDEIEVGDPL